MYRGAYIILLTLASCSVDFATCHEDKPATNVKTPQERFDVGLFSVEYYYNETKFQNKLRLSKSYYNVDIKNNQSPSADPIVSIKTGLLKELVRCDNLSLARQGYQNLLECLPLESHIFNTVDTRPELTTGHYIRRSSFRAKRRNRGISDQTSRYEIYLYPLRKDVVQRNIESSVAANNLADFNANINLGYYFEAHFLKTPITCSGEAFFSINASEPFIHPENEPYPEHLAELDYLLEQGIQNGYLVNLQNVLFVKPDFSDSVGLNFDFMIVQQQSFPYLTASHKMTINGLEPMFKYEATVGQVLNSDSGDSSAYNTTVSILSTSLYAPMLNFELEQVFVNHNIESGFEQMIFAHPIFSMLVDAQWDKSAFAKSVKLFIVDSANKEMIRKSLSKLTEGMELKYNDSNDDITVSLRFKRGLIDSMKSALNGLYDQDKQTRDEL